MVAILYCGKDSGSLTDLIFFKIHEIGSSSRTIKPESLSPTLKVEDTNGKYPGSKRLGLEVRRWLNG